MASTTYHSIVIRAANEDGSVTRTEGLAGETLIYPGKLLENSSGTYLRHNTAAGSVTPILIALESVTNDTDGSFAIDVAYDNGDTVYAAIARAGDRYYMWLADGETAVAGSLLQSDGDGCLAVLAAVVDATLAYSVVGTAVAAVDNALGGAPARIVVEIT